MASVLHRTTKEFLRSVNTPDFSPATWVINPDLTAVAGFLPKYWVITGDVVTLMDQAARDAVDSALAADAVLADKALEKARMDVERVLVGLAEVLVDEFNLRAANTNAILNAITTANNLGEVKTAVALIADIPTRDLSQVRTAIKNKIDAG